MALPDRYPPPSPHRSTFLPPPSSYPERSPRYRGPALADVEATFRNPTQRLDLQWSESQRRWIPIEETYENEYLSGPSISSSVSSSDRPEPSPPLPSNAPFYVPRTPPSVIPHPQYQNSRSEYRMDTDPAGYEHDYRVQYHPSYQPPLPSNQHLPPPCLQPQIPIYDSQPRWAGPPDRQPSPDRSRPPPPPFMNGQGQPRERERLTPLRPPPPPPATSVQRSYSQGRHARAPSNSRRNPYPPNDGRGRVSSGSRYQGGSGKRRFEKRSGYGQRGSGH